MTVDWWTLGLQSINFLVLVWLLHRFLYKPVSRIIERRREETEAVLARSAEAERRAEAEAEEYRSKLAGVEEQRRQTISNARIEAERQRDEILAAARHQAENFLEAASHDVARERLEANRKLRQTAVALAVDLSRRLLEQTVDQTVTEKCLARIEDSIRSMSKAELSQLTGPETASPVVSVETAPPLQPAGQEQWRKRLEDAMGNGVHIKFSHNADLIAGARARFSAADLDFSWSRILENAQGELTDDIAAE